jgi:hypothetical protein
MVPPPATDDPSGGSATDDGVEQLSEQELYAIVRVAAEDAVLGAFGTVMLVAIGAILIWAGTSLLFALSPLPSAVGVVLIAYGAYLALSSLRIIPPAREWV